VALPGFASAVQCDSQFFDDESGRFETQLTTRDRHFASFLCLSPPDSPVHLRYCDGTRVHLTAGTLVTHRCGGGNCWEIEKVTEGRLYLLCCWWTLSGRRSVAVPDRRARRLKRKGMTGVSSWRTVAT